MSGYVAIVDYGVGNLLSVTRALSFVGLESRVTGDASEIERASAVVLPGVGAFPDAASRLRATGLELTLKSEAERKPFLGICLGMQLLLGGSEEIRPTKGLGLIAGSAERIPTELKLPQIGWNSLAVVHENPLTKGIDGRYVYFVHSFHGCVDDERDLACVTDYGCKVTAMIARGNVFGCQFHPEKSGDTGLQILKNFGELLK